MLSSSKEMVKYQFDLNKQLADENRNWQERMANSAHQREIADLKASGLNPVLSVTGGSGANTPSGSTASVSDGAGYAAALANLEAARINSATALQTTRLNNATQMFTHLTPGGNSVAGQVQYFSEALGLPLDEVLGDVGSMAGTSAKGTGKLAKAFGSNSKFNKNANNSMYGAMSDLYKKYTNAFQNGNYRKAKKYRQQYDRLAYFYPNLDEKITGTYQYDNRQNDYFGKQGRIRQKAIRQVFRKYY